jgi:hypothetical protein
MAVALEYIRVWFFAYFALELLPGVRNHICFFFLSHFLFQPVFEALKMGVFNGAVALTGG